MHPTHPLPERQPMPAWAGPMPEAFLSATREATPAPVVVFVAGQPGAGKTEMGDLVQVVLSPRGGAVRICSDLYKPQQPQYDLLLAADVRTAGSKVRSETRGWQADAEARARRYGFDAVVETALADPDEVRAAVSAYRAAGYTIEFVVVATPPALSMLGILDRFLGGAANSGGRYVDWANHDACVRALPDVLSVVESDRLADRVTVLRRDHTVLYCSARTGGVPGAAAAVLAEHNRPWTARETAVFRVGTARSERRVHTELADEDRRLAVQRDAERAAAMAEPVRRGAQPVETAPGVAYHRLSRREFWQIWHEDVVPGYLDNITPHEQPVVTHVMAQPGAGKTRLTHLILRARRHRRAVRIVGDRFKVLHPDYRQLLLTDPRTAGERIREDYQTWQTMAMAEVRSRRGDMVVEMSPGDADHFRASVALDKAAGYRVELVVLAVRGADSRQGVAERYARQCRNGLAARYTTATGHDRCLAALSDVAAAAETESLADMVVVIRRDHTALYDNERGPDGTWIRPTGAARVLLAEQSRPYSLPEAAAFTATQRRLLRAMPQLRADLQEITALAQPLLPAPFRPSELPTDAPVTNLPVLRNTYADSSDFIFFNNTL